MQYSFETTIARPTLEIPQYPIFRGKTVIVTISEVPQHIQPKKKMWNPPILYPEGWNFGGISIRDLAYSQKM